MSLKNILKIANYYNVKYNFKPSNSNHIKTGGWFSKDPDEKLIKELSVEEFISLCEDADLQEVKRAAGYFDMAPKFQVTFKYGPKKNYFWLAVFDDGSGGYFGEINSKKNPQDLTKWTLPTFPNNATGKDLIVRLTAVKNTINQFDR